MFIGVWCSKYSTALQDTMILEIQHLQVLWKRNRNLKNNDAPSKSILFHAIGAVCVTCLFCSVESVYKELHTTWKTNASVAISRERSAWWSELPKGHQSYISIVSHDTIHIQAAKSMPNVYQLYKRQASVTKYSNDKASYIAKTWAWLWSIILAKQCDAANSPRALPQAYQTSGTDASLTIQFYNAVIATDLPYRKGIAICVTVAIQSLKRACSICKISRKAC